MLILKKQYVKEIITKSYIIIVNIKDHRYMI
jgi:hypothetical protein